MAGKGVTVNDGKRRMNVERKQCRLLRTTAIVAIGMLLVLVIIPCPPWSLKVVMAERVDCMANLKDLHRAVQQRSIPFDEQHAPEIREVIQELALTCAEGTELKGRPARYLVRVTNGECIITEEAGNHPARKRFLAGAVPEERFEVNAEGQVRQARQKVR